MSHTKELSLDHLKVLWRTFALMKALKISLPSWPLWPIFGRQGRHISGVLPLLSILLNSGKALGVLPVVAALPLVTLKNQMFKRTDVHKSASPLLNFLLICAESPSNVMRYLEKQLNLMIIELLSNLYL